MVNIPVVREELEGEKLGKLKGNLCLHSNILFCLNFFCNKHVFTLHVYIFFKTSNSWGRTLGDTKRAHSINIYSGSTVHQMLSRH